MTKVPVSALKPALTYEQQINRLVQVHNLSIINPDSARKILEKVNYYRLSAYGIGLKKKGDPERYQDGVTLNRIFRLYCFDSQFRNNIIHTVEQIEIQLRSQIADQLAIQYGPDGYMDVNNFDDKKNSRGNSVHECLIEHFQDEVRRNKTLPFVKHHIETYGGRFPIWAAVELMTFGNISSFYSIMKPCDGISSRLEAGSSYSIKGKMSLDRFHAIQAFNQYVSAYDPADIKIKLKIAHTFRVASLADTIAHSLALSPGDCDFAWASGLLHDIGRFEQLRRYHTFNDALSVNHGALSADILFHEGKISAFGIPAEWYPMLETVIRLHNVYQLPDSLTPEMHRFAAILRDADKVDIFRVNCETPLEEIYDCPLQEFKTSSISDAVLADCLACRTVEASHRATAADALAAHIALVFGLEYPESIRQADTAGYLRQMMNFTSENQQTQKRLGQIRSAVNDFIHKHLS